MNLSPSCLAIACVYSPLLKLLHVTFPLTIHGLKAEVKAEVKAEPSSMKKRTRPEVGWVGGSRTPQPGDCVECNFPPPGGHGWEAGAVTRTASGGFRVKYDGDSTEWGEKVLLKRKFSWRPVGGCEPAIGFAEDSDPKEMTLQGSGQERGADTSHHGE